jgi:hypothetical protein
VCHAASTPRPNTPNRSWFRWTGGGGGWMTERCLPLDEFAHYVRIHLSHFPERLGEIFWDIKQPINNQYEGYI